MSIDPANLQHIKDRLEEGRYLVPPHMWGAVERYYLNGIPPGSFLQAVLSNNLMEAFNRADDENAANMRQWCRFLYNYVPYMSYGSPEHYELWLEKFHAPVEAD